MRLIECVPNISEGNNKSKIEQILKELSSVSGVEILGCEMGKSANRTVITFIAPPETAKDAALKLIKKSAELIDMRKHKGVHPRIGCVDVCPFIPYKKISLEECAEIAKNTARETGQILGIPVYLYGAAAINPAYTKLSFLRKGGYENLPAKIAEFPPDFGIKNYNDSVAKTGVLCIGARKFLIAYNINLNTKDLTLCKEIAKELRALPGIKTLGWYIEEYGFCQVSINIEDYKKAPLYLVYETCKNIAGKFNTKVTGSELVGLTPKEALLDSAKFYLNKENRIMQGIPHEEAFDIVIKNLNLNQIEPFVPIQKVLELKIKSLN